MSERGERKPLEAYLKRVGYRPRPFTDLYAYLLRARWGVVVGLTFASYVSLNLIFAALYWAVPGSIANTDGSFVEAFFFSVQTYAAIGYGFMYSQGTWGNTLVVIEAFVSLFTIALLTGIEWSNRSKPHGLSIGGIEYTMVRWGIYISILLIIYFMGATQQPFIYFQF